ncbi:MAG: hypothetical protein L6Q35_14955 [Phycisphaerales bacterium]|nr:hypothetical protein [Phycisphaerales bacterium]
MNGLARSMSSCSVRKLACVASLVGLSAAGCQTARPNDRADPYARPGDAALNDPAVSPRTLLEFTDQVTARLADKIPAIPEISNAPQKVVIAVGAITNRTQTPSNDFVTVRSKIFSDLVNSTVAQHAMIVETLEVMDEQAARYAQPGGPDRLDEGRYGAGGSARYDPAITYILNGEFGEISRAAGRDSTYIFNWRLVNLKTSAVVFADRYQSTQTRTN